jgi:hypothetical protein
LGHSPFEIKSFLSLNSSRNIIFVTKLQYDQKIKTCYTQKRFYKSLYNNDL